MTIYFYHTQDLKYIYSELERGNFPSHFLYGATKLKDFEIDVMIHQFKRIKSRLMLGIYVACRIIKCRKHIDAVYATHYVGLEIIIILRAIGLFDRKIVIWHHQPIIKSSSIMREIFGKLFYKGIDDMFFFSQKLYEDSLKTSKAKEERMHVGHWGADLDFYDRVLKTFDIEGRKGFISTGKEKRDMSTLVKAFNATGAPIDIYLSRMNGTFSYEKLFKDLIVNYNVHVHFIVGLIPNKLSELVNKAACVVICCEETKYTVGLTTVVEALALGLPIICSRNPQIPIDFEKEKCGISVPYYDTDGWIRAIKYINTHPAEAREMGHNGRKLAEKLYNDRQCARDVASVLLSK